MFRENALCDPQPPIGTLPETQRAAELLVDRGIIEIRQPQNQYRIKPKN